MALFIECNKNWENSVWAKQKILSLIHECKRKKIDYYFINEANDLKEYKDVYNKEFSCIVIAKMIPEDFDRLLDSYKDYNLPKISFIQFDDFNVARNINCVINDVNDYMERAYKILEKRSAKHPALLGMLSNGLQDSLKINNFKNNNYFNDKYIFESKKNFNDAILKLFKCDKKIDSIIVSNDLQAIRLIKILDLIDSNWNDKLLLISYGNLALSHLSKPSISSGTLSFGVSAKEVIRIYETLMKNSHIHSIQTVVDSQILEKESSNKNNPKGIVFSKSNLPNTKTIKDIIFDNRIEKLESLLADLDDIDYDILYGLMKKYNRKRICEIAHCSEGTIKYRLNKYKEIIHHNNANELINLLNEYIDPNKLLIYKDSQNL